jgi:formamidopyrimidine-DNA glycosylase
MPELPEVEQFRRLLIPLISTKHALQLERHSLDRQPPRKFLSDADIDEIHAFKYVVSDVLRKGKLICMVLTSKNNNAVTKRKYLMVHMGMTGRISNSSHIPKLMELSDTTEYPPPHTYLKFVVGPYNACFSDPRKFGHVVVKDCMDLDFDNLAPDAWQEVVTKSKDHGEMTVDETAVVKLSEQKLGIKALLLDQNRAVSGVGNYLADEVLYQMEMHPDQKFLSTGQAEALLRKLYDILNQAIDCNDKGEDFSEKWLFHYRWSKGKKTEAKDFHGRSITFLTSGGRTSAIVPSIQKLRGQRTKAKASTQAATTTTATVKLVKTMSVTTAETTKKQATKTPVSRKRKTKSMSTSVGKRTHDASRRSPRLLSGK